MKLEFPDGTTKEFTQGISGYDIAISISEHLARMAVGMILNNTLSDLYTSVSGDTKIRFLTPYPNEKYPGKRRYDYYGSDRFCPLLFTGLLLAAMKEQWRFLLNIFVGSIPFGLPLSR